MTPIRIRLLPFLSSSHVAAFAALMWFGLWQSSTAHAQCEGAANGIVEGAETCDDGNAAPGDGCANCRVEDGWLCNEPERAGALVVDHYSGDSGANWSEINPAGAFQSSDPHGASVALRGIHAFGTHEIVLQSETGDRETFGIVLGYSPGDATNGSADYLLFDWLAEHKGFLPRAAPGLELTRVQGAPSRDQLLFRQGGVRGIRLASGIGNNGWNAGTSYRFTVEYSSGHLRIWVDQGGGANLEVDIDAASAGYPGGFPDGEIGFYNHSQQGVSYRFEGVAAPSECNQRPELGAIEVRRHIGDGDALLDVPAAFMDPDGLDILSVAVTMPPAVGNARPDERGRIRWSPELPEMVGTLRLSYEACDSHAVVPACSVGMASIVTLECETDSHCPMLRPHCVEGQCLVCNTDEQCDDGNDCTDDRCTEAGCTVSPAAAGTACTGGVCDGTGVCGGCRDSAMGSAMDEGCSPAAPMCDGERGVCVQCVLNRDCTRGVCADDACVTCEDSVSGSSIDSGCSTLRPLCVGEGSSLRCVACEDDRSGGMDLGCSAEEPVCNEGAGCGVCIDSGDSLDEGCSAATPHCLGSGSMARCAACASDSNCGEGGSCVDGACVLGCRDGSDCTESDRPHCDGSGVCVQCRTASECPGGRMCLEGECQQCGTDAHCDDGVCAEGRCVECEANRDCSGALVCRANSCVPECDNDAHCSGATPICSRGSCVECETPAHCEAGDRCLDSECVGTCMDDADCPRGMPRCDVSSGQCVLCLGDGDCPDGMCEGGECQATCEGDEDCAAAEPFCVDAVCVACAGDDDCPGEQCFDGVCAECQGATDCSEGEFCDGGSCVGCRGDMDCPDGYCDMSLQRCAASCESDEQCEAPASHCDEERCVECVEDAHCSNGEACDGGRCVGACGSADDCAPGQECVDQRCIGCLDDDYCVNATHGQVCLAERRECGCTNDGDCSWGHCDRGLQACVGGAPRQYGAGGCSAGGEGHAGWLALGLLLLVGRRRRR